MSSHGIDPRAHDDPRNRYPSDEQFYGSDRPDRAQIPEDRPRGGRGGSPAKHRGTWATVALVAGIILLIILGIALFP
ncbi:MULTISPECIES: hypothetical protein [unclassified Streptomyces]|uniref:hypothetical protein n=1 Tax=unclassified Streptomyces TaxID=2593676 RepID=UPI00224EC729|nr:MULTISPECIES: hypothetical protein [unclassified Streptomyces]MCX5054187.1 hypothetical protein [Streptomyces sp. NBC_00474]MCX5063099.1 hypothetical protein [Streptomyces sp. NBC_00452]MCX5250939.1 hypothetical protein [Streptomyces sp. NBC_00201]MCX5291132.1 hypothetical protein [Streptomyces sp. NBC_00183]